MSAAHEPEVVLEIGRLVIHGADELDGSAAALGRAVRRELSRLVASGGLGEIRARDIDRVTTPLVRDPGTRGGLAAGVAKAVHGAIAGGPR